MSGGVCSRWSLRCRLALLVLAGLMLGATARAAKPQVLVIESYHAGYAWDQAYTRGLREQLAGVADLNFFEMDTKRRPASEYPARADAAWQRFEQLQPALVVLADDNALKLLGRRFAATAVPVVYLGINQNPRHYFDQPPRLISGVLERPLLRRSIAYLNQVMGRPLERVLVLFDDGTTAQTLVEEVFGGHLSEQLGSMQVVVRLIGTEADWQAAISDAPTQGFDLIVIGLYHTLRDDKGVHVPEERILSWSAAHSTLPLFGFWSFAVGPGMTAGGLVLDGYDQGVAAAVMARAILAGEAVPRLPVTPESGTLMFSRERLAHWGIRLPDAIARQAVMLP